MRELPDDALLKALFSQCLALTLSGPPSDRIGIKPLFAECALFMNGAPLRYLARVLRLSLAMLGLSKVDYAALVAVMVVLVAGLVGCEADTRQLERVGRPVVFNDLRETAAWCENFDTAWWKEIDAAYDAYDLEVERVARAAWATFTRDIVDFKQIGFPDEPRSAQALWRQHLRVKRQLGDVEREFVARLDAVLPPQADEFLALLSARAAFWRATSCWVLPSQRAAGPLEILGVAKRTDTDAVIVRAATETYTRLAPIAERAAQQRYDAYIAYCEALPSIEAEISAAVLARASVTGDRAIRAADRQVERVTKLPEQRRARMNDHDCRVADEELRVALLRENRVFAESIGDDARRQDFLERVDAFLHEGMRSAPSLRALRELALRTAERVRPGDDKVRVRIEEVFTTALAEQRIHRANLASASKDVRKKAYERGVQVTRPLYETLKELLEPLPIDRLDSAAVLFAGGQRSLDEAVEDVLRQPDAEPVAEVAIDESMAASRNGDVRLLFGYPLSPSTIRTLAARLALSEADTKALDDLRAVESMRVIEATKTTIKTLTDTARIIGDDPSRGNAEARARELMRELRAAADRIRSIDRDANARLLADSGRLGRVLSDDPRMEVAQLELDLLAMVGVLARDRDYANVGGVTSEAIANPFELVRAMDATVEQRDAAEAIVLARADDLRAAHADLVQGIQRNLSDIFVRIFDMRSSESRPKSAWYPSEVGAKGVALRFEIADEIGRVLGADVAEAYLAEFRRATEPEMEPERPHALSELDRFARGRLLNGSTLEATSDLRLVVDEFLDSADEHRSRALRQLHEWRARSVRLEGSMGAKQWNDLAVSAPVGSILRSRVLDIDARVIARCESLLAIDASARQGLQMLRAFPVDLPARMAPYFEPN